MLWMSQAFYCPRLWLLVHSTPIPPCRSSYYLPLPPLTAARPRSVLASDLPLPRLPPGHASRLKDPPLVLSLDPLALRYPHLPRPPRYVPVQAPLVQPHSSRPRWQPHRPVEHVIARKVQHRGAALRPRHHAPPTAPPAGRGGATAAPAPAARTCPATPSRRGAARRAQPSGSPMR